MAPKLYVLPASHPCATVMKALELKRVPYTRVDLVPALSKLFQRARFGGPTVPGIVFDDGRKLLGSRAILRALEAQHPEPSLAVGDPRVIEAEDWGDGVLQPLVRRIVWQALTADPAAQLTYLEGARLVPPTPRVLAKAFSRPLAFVLRHANHATDDALRADLAALPGHLDRVDAWIADGTLGGAKANAADLQIGASLRLLLTFDDLAPLVDGRPAGALARRWFGAYPGHVGPGALPAAPAG